LSVSFIFFHFRSFLILHFCEYAYSLLFCTVLLLPPPPSDMAAFLVSDWSVDVNMALPLIDQPVMKPWFLCLIGL